MRALLAFRAARSAGRLWSCGREGDVEIEAFGRGYIPGRAFDAETAGTESVTDVAVFGYVPQGGFVQILGSGKWIGLVGRSRVARGCERVDEGIEGGIERVAKRCRGLFAGLV